MTFAFQIGAGFFERFSKAISASQISFTDRLRSYYLTRHVRVLENGAMDYFYAMHCFSGEQSLCTGRKNNRVIWSDNYECATVSKETGKEEVLCELPSEDGSDVKTFRVKSLGKDGIYEIRIVTRDSAGSEIGRTKRTEKTADGKSPLSFLDSDPQLADAVRITFPNQKPVFLEPHLDGKWWQYRSASLKPYADLPLINYFFHCRPQAPTILSCEGVGPDRGKVLLVKDQLFETTGPFESKKNTIVPGVRVEFFGGNLISRPGTAAK